jgi:hypothetical protein
LWLGGPCRVGIGIGSAANITTVLEVHASVSEKVPPRARGENEIGTACSPLTCLLVLNLKAFCTNGKNFAWGFLIPQQASFFPNYCVPDQTDEEQQSRIVTSNPLRESPVNWRMTWSPIPFQSSRLRLGELETLATHLPEIARPVFGLATLRLHSMKRSASGVSV